MQSEGGIETFTSVLHFNNTDQLVTVEHTLKSYAYSRHQLNP